MPPTRTASEIATRLQEVGSEISDLAQEILDNLNDSEENLRQEKTTTTRFRETLEFYSGSTDGGSKARAALAPRK